MEYSCFCVSRKFTGLDDKRGWINALTNYHFSTKMMILYVLKLWGVSFNFKIIVIYPDNWYFYTIKNAILYGVVMGGSRNIFFRKYLQGTKYTMMFITLTLCFSTFCNIFMLNVVLIIYIISQVEVFTTHQRCKIYWYKRHWPFKYHECCAIYDICPKRIFNLNFTKSRLSIRSVSVVQSFWNFCSERGSIITIMWL